MSRKDLISLATRTTEEQHRIATLGGYASGIARKKKKTMKQAMEAMLGAKIPVDKLNETLAKLGFTDEDMNAQTAIAYAQVIKAIKGDTRSAEFCRDTVGEYIGAEAKAEESEKREIHIPAKDIGRAFVDVNRDIDDRMHREYYFEGGRGSLKSSYISEKIIELLVNNEHMCAVVLRKVKDTLKDSVYSQLEWAIGTLSETYPELAERYKLTKSPLEITDKITGQKIYFRGADDYGKIKSLKPPKDKYIGVVWYEEFDQFAGMNEVRKINQSLMRGGEDFVYFYSYNTPASRQHFVNKEKRIPKENRLVHLSDYRSAPIQWLGQAFVDEAEFLKSVNENIYKNEYLGEETGIGGNVFENIEIRDITDEEIANFNYEYQGMDFGWFPDPLAWTKCSYDAATKKLYIYDEFVVNKMNNADVWEHLKTEKGVKNEDLITGDSADKRSIGDFRAYGSMMRDAEKGPGSVEYSMKWLSGLAGIVIDAKRCPKSAEEFSEYEYEKDSDGNYISAYVDANNHCIDSIRYATNRIWKKRGS